MYRSTDKLKKIFFRSIFGKKNRDWRNGEQYKKWDCGYVYGAILIYMGEDERE